MVVERDARELRHRIDQATVDARALEGRMGEQDEYGSQPVEDSMALL
jgi:hypothetical protein